MSYPEIKSMSFPLRHTPDHAAPGVAALFSFQECLQHKSAVDGVANICFVFAFYPLSKASSWLSSTFLSEQHVCFQEASSGELK